MSRRRRRRRRRSRRSVYAKIVRLKVISHLNLHFRHATHQKRVRRRGRPSASVVVVGTMPKNKGGGKEDRRAKKAELNREREKGRRRRHVVERNDKEIASFAKVLLSEGLELQEVARTKDVVPADETVSSAANFAR